jgi:hypothetical protein
MIYFSSGKGKPRAFAAPRWELAGTGTVIAVLGWGVGTTCRRHKLRIFFADLPRER